MASGSSLPLRPSNLVAGDDIGSRDVLLYDRSTGQLTNLTPGDAGGQVDIFDPPRISADGQTVVFNTNQDGLKLVDVGSGELRDLPFADARRYELSADGSRVVVEYRTPGESSIDVYDTTTNQSVNSITRQGFSPLNSPKISDDGRLVVMHSSVDINPGDTGLNSGGVYLWDLTSDQNTFIAAGENTRAAFTISADGSLVVFESTAPLVLGVDPAGTGCAQQPSAYAYEVASGNITHVGCVAQDAPGETPSTPSLSGNGDLMVAGISELVYRYGP